MDYTLKLDDDMLIAFSWAIMGRLDIVDLVGKHTAEKVAERVSNISTALRFLLLVMCMQGTAGLLAYVI